MAKTLTLRLNDDQAAMIEQLQAVLEIKTASKCVYHLLGAFPQLMEETATLKTELHSAESHIEVLLERIEGARSSAALLLEKVGQEDLLT